MKGLKELKLPVGNDEWSARQADVPPDACRTFSSRKFPVPAC